MIAFDLKAALEGSATVTRLGREVSQLHLFEGVKSYPLIGVVDGVTRAYTLAGRCFISEDFDLFMEPEMLSGVVNVYEDNTVDIEKVASTGKVVKARIDLSQFPVGHGLEDE